MQSRRYIHRCRAVHGWGEGWTMIVTAPQVAAESGTHVHLNGLCADCGSAWPCERADVSAYQLAYQRIDVMADRQLVPLAGE